MESAAEEPWYAVRCVFRFPPRGEGDVAVYEERIRLWQAASFDEALERAEHEAEAYASSLSAEYAGLAQAFHLAVGAQLRDGDEVFSLMRDSDLDPDQYVARFFETGDERQGHVE